MNLTEDILEMLTKSLVLSGAIADRCNCSASWEANELNCELNDLLDAINKWDEIITRDFTVEYQLKEKVASHLEQIEKDFTMVETSDTVGFTVTLSRREWYYLQNFLLGRKLELK